ncbi:MAG: putative nikkomycin biosynthesis protein carboxylase [Cyanobacteria bacterium RYN_339]|nr:putative nikkomycin biosynthesis protein carboxylase [Cyanobacteria bacterium RYN_339]
MSNSHSFLLIMAATHGLYAQSFIRELKAQGHRVVIITRADALGYDWPRQDIDALYAVNDIFDAAEVRNAVSYLARTERIDRLVGPGEYDIELAASLREHLRVGGMGETTARYFRDKLAMRERAGSNGIRIPAFIGAIHHPAIAKFLDEVPGPWVLKPRMAASSKGIKVLRRADEVWQALAALGDKASEHLIERFTAGDVYHVDGVVSGRQVLFASAHKYGRPILDLHTNGGVYTTWRVGEDTPEAQALFALNQQVVETFGLAAGVFHIEYIQGREDGEFYFLEASARVGAGLIEEMVEAESGINLWEEWARLEVGQVVPPYALKRSRDVYAGVLATAAPYETPDASPYLAADVQALPSKPYHMGLLVTADAPEKVSARLAELAERVQRELTIHI